MNLDGQPYREKGAAFRMVVCGHVALQGAHQPAGDGKAETRAVPVAPLRDLLKDR